MSELKQHYTRLLRYEEACKVIDFVKAKNDDNYACITAGGVSLSLTDECLQEVRDFCSKSFPRWEIVDEHPEKINSRIAELIKKKKL